MAVMMRAERYRQGPSSPFGVLCIDPFLALPEVVMTSILATSEEVSDYDA